MFLTSTRLSLQHTEILDYRFPRTCTDVLLSVLFQKPCLCHHAYQLRSRKSPKFPWHVRAEIGRRLFREKNPHRAVNPFRPRKMSFATRYPRDLRRRHCVPTRDSRGKLPVQFPSPAEKWNESVALFEKSLSCGINYGDERIILKVRSQFSPKH